MEINQPQLQPNEKTIKIHSPPPNTPNGSNEINLLSQGAFGCTFQNKGKGKGLTQPSTMTFHNKIANQFIKKLKCVPPKENYKYELEKTHSSFISKIQPIDLLDFSSENNEEEIVNTEIVKETLYGEIIQNIPNYYLYFSPLLSSCPFDIGILPHEERMKCKLFNDMDDQRSNLGFFNGMLSPEDTPQRLYINSKVQFVEGTSMLSYFKKILWSDLFYKDGGNIGELSAFFITRFIRSYRHLLKAIRVLQKGPESNRIIVHYDLKDQNIIYDTKRGIPIIIDFGLSFDKLVLEKDLHPKTLNEVFYTYYSKYTPWPIDVVIMSYISKVVLLKKGNNDNLMKEIYENEMVNVEDLKRVCDEFFEKNEIFSWIDTLQNPNKAGLEEGNTAAVEEERKEGENKKETEKENKKQEDNNEKNEIEKDENKDEEIKTNKVINSETVNEGDTGNTSDNLIVSIFNFNTPLDVKNVNPTSVESVPNDSLNQAKSIRDKMKIQWYAYIDSFNGKVWKELSTDLTQRYALWDVYSISVCFLEYIYQLELLTGKYKIPPLFIDFVEELKKVFDKV